jgi:hypothetical protein
MARAAGAACTVLPPEVVRKVGGDLVRGFQILNRFVVKMRRKAAAEWRKLPA